MSTPSLSVVIPTHDTRELTLRCLGSLTAGGVAPVEIILVDDVSSDGTADAVRAGFPDVVVLEAERNLGFSRAANLGVGRASGELILVLNSDTEVDDGALAALVGAFADDESLGIGGAELLDPDGTAQWRAGRWPSPTWLFTQASGLGSLLGRIPGRGLVGGGAARSGSVDWVSGAAMAVRREVWRSCGPFDERYRFYCQDLDLCASARRAGWAVAVIPGFVVFHHQGATIGASPGASGSFHPAHLWTDLVRFTAKIEGAAAAERAAAALRAGGRVRLAGRAVAALVASDRAAWARDSDGFREGVKALSAATDRRA
jgi:GT2 family glycosyltransferase